MSTNEYDLVVCGSGTMGSGIALCAAQNGIYTLLYDNNAQAVEKAEIGIMQQLAGLIAKQKLSEEEAIKIKQCLSFSSEISHCVAPFIIEAIIEDVAIKQNLYQQLESINSPETIIASNTSSLSITQLQQNLQRPQNFGGMHFFNPATIMKLVEVIEGKETAIHTLEAIQQLAQRMKKTTVLAKDAPGFIVNRVARPYYLEALELLALGIPIETIDEALENAGFKMGAFKLMDLIGIDINYKVSESIYEAMGNNPRLKPSPIQAQKVAAGKLGKKTGEGFYKYPLAT